MANAVTPAPFQSGFRLIDGSQLNSALANPVVSTQNGITAHAGGGKTNATLITAALNNVTTVATTADSIKLPPAIAGRIISISNNGANAFQVFGSNNDTINSVATGTGVAQAAGSTIDYECITAPNWVGLGAASGAYTGTFDGVVGGITPAAGTFTTLAATGITTLSDDLIGGPSTDIAINTNKFTVTASSGNTSVAGTLGVTGLATLTAGANSADNVTFTAASKGVVLKQGANGNVGTFVANGTTTVTISNTNVAISDAIIISLNTVGGTVGVQPHISSITAGTGFTVICTASDTSTYNYAMIKNAA